MNSSLNSSLSSNSSSCRPALLHFRSFRIWQSSTRRRLAISIVWLCKAFLLDMSRTTTFESFMSFCSLFRTCQSELFCSRWWWIFDVQVLWKHLTVCRAVFTNGSKFLVQSELFCSRWWWIFDVQVLWKHLTVCRAVFTNGSKFLVNYIICNPFRDCGRAQLFLGHLE